MSHTNTPAGIDMDELEYLARAADQDGGEHVYTNPRDSNNWCNNSNWHHAASPAAILQLIALARAGQQATCQPQTATCQPSGAVCQAGESARDGMPPLPAGDEAGMFRGACIVYTGGEMRAYGDACARTAWNNCASLNQPLIADLRAQLASERAAKEYEQRHAAESEKALAEVQAKLASAQRDAGQNAIRQGWQAAANAISDRAAGHYRNGDYALQDECLQCASMLRDLSPGRAQLTNTTTGE